MENLPTDIMEDIFSRLPAAPTLLQCKRVSKTWRELLKKYKHKTGMLFAYISKGKTKLYYGDQDKVTLESYYSNKTLARYEHVKFRHEHVRYIRYGHVEFEYSHYHDNYIVGSCNGLVCLRSGICNPVTGEFLSFSDTKPIFSVSGGIGFGYLLSTNEYKVVSIRSSNGMQQQGHHVQVCTIGSQSGWRRKQNIPYEFDKPGIFANGSIHWMCNTAENGRGQQYKISAFDLEDEKFKDVPTPPLYNPYPWQNEYVELMLLGGNLCIVHHMRTHKMIDIWAFRRNTPSISSSTPKCGGYYDKSWSWTVQFRIPEKISRPFAITEKNEVLTWRHHQQLYCYNAATSTITKSWDGGEKTTSCVRAIPHVNTLVSLKELGECSTVMRA